MTPNQIGAFMDVDELKLVLSTASAEQARRERDPTSSSDPLPTPYKNQQFFTEQERYYTENALKNATEQRLLAEKDAMEAAAMKAASELRLAKAQREKESADFALTAAAEEEAISLETEAAATRTLQQLKNEKIKITQAKKNNTEKLAQTERELVVFEQQLVEAQEKALRIRDEASHAAQNALKAAQEEAEIKAQTLESLRQEEEATKLAAVALKAKNDAALQSKNTSLSQAFAYQKSQEQIIAQRQLISISAKQALDAAKNKILSNFILRQQIQTQALVIKSEKSRILSEKKALEALEKKEKSLRDFEANQQKKIEAYLLEQKSAETYGALEEHLTQLHEQRAIQIKEKIHTLAQKAQIEQDVISTEQAFIDAETKASKSLQCRISAQNKAARAAALRAKADDELAEAYENKKNADALAHQTSLQLAKVERQSEALVAVETRAQLEALKQSELNLNLRRRATETSLAKTKAMAITNLEERRRIEADTIALEAFQAKLESAHQAKLASESRAHADMRMAALSEDFRKTEEQERLAKLALIQIQTDRNNLSNFSHSAVLQKLQREQELLSAEKEAAQEHTLALDAIEKSIRAQKKAQKNSLNRANVERQSRTLAVELSRKERKILKAESFALDRSRAAIEALKAKENYIQKNAILEHQNAEISEQLALAESQKNILLTQKKISGELSLKKQADLLTVEQELLDAEQSRIKALEQQLYVKKQRCEAEKQQKEISENKTKIDLKAKQLAKENTHIDQILSEKTKLANEAQTLAIQAKQKAVYAAKASAEAAVLAQKDSEHFEQCQRKTKALSLKLSRTQRRLTRAEEFKAQQLILQNEAQQQALRITEKLALAENLQLQKKTAAVKAQKEQLKEQQNRLIIEAQYKDNEEQRLAIEQVKTAEIQKKKQASDALLAEEIETLESIKNLSAQEESNLLNAQKLHEDIKINITLAHEESLKIQQSLTKEQQTQHIQKENNRLADLNLEKMHHQDQIENDVHFLSQHLSKILIDKIGQLDHQQKLLVQKIHKETEELSCVKELNKKQQQIIRDTQARIDLALVNAQLADQESLKVQETLEIEQKFYAIKTEQILMANKAHHEMQKQEQLENDLHFLSQQLSRILSDKNKQYEYEKKLLTQKIETELQELFIIKETNAHEEQIILNKKSLAECATLNAQLIQNEACTIKEALTKEELTYKIQQERYFVTQRHLNEMEQQQNTENELLIVSQEALSTIHEKTQLLDDRVKLLKDNIQKNQELITLTEDNIQNELKQQEIQNHLILKQQKLAQDQNSLRQQKLASLTDTLLHQQQIEDLKRDITYERALTQQANQKVQKTTQQLKEHINLSRRSHDTWTQEAQQILKKSPVNSSKLNSSSRKILQYSLSGLLVSACFFSAVLIQNQSTLIHNLERDLRKNYTKTDPPAPSLTTKSKIMESNVPTFQLSLELSSLKLHNEKTALQKEK